MKNKTNIFLILIMSMVLACSDEFSETVEIGSLVPESLSNEEGVNFSLTAAYSVLDGTSNVTGNWQPTGDNWWMDVISDDAHKGSTDSDQAELFQLETFNWSGGNNYIFNKWRALYVGANRANAVLVLINSLDNPEDFTQQAAEARFLRGHYNFELQRLYGFVSYISEENYAASEFDQPNTTDVWPQIEADFQFAADNLPSSQSSGISRAISWSARAYLGKAYLYQQKWADALMEFNAVINSGTYSLNTEFVDNFKEFAENSPEAVFIIQFDVLGTNAPNGNHGGTLNFGGPNGWCCGFYQPTQDLVNAFQTDGSGLPLLDTYNQNDVANDAGIFSEDPFTPHAGPLDPRLDYTVGRRGIDYNGWDIHPGKDWIRASFSDVSGPYSPKKNVYHNGETANVGTGGWGQQRSGINYHFIRYADVLLMGAEAAVETGDLATALNYVNQVRNRAKNSTFVSNDGGVTPAANYDIEPYSSFPDETFARKAVRFERRLELSMEGHRLFDIRRWGNAQQIITDYLVNEARTIPNITSKFEIYEPKHDLLPIPQRALDESKGALQQSPLWD
ncbi:RagB/SusD family nutrient uptake outer membrane protein [Flagellimonas sp. 2504JD4-2]